MNRTKDLYKYLLTRLAIAPLMLWLISSLVFLLLRVAPGDPIDAILGTRASEVARSALRARLGLDQSLLDQYYNFLKGLLKGDLGEAIISQEPVREIISKCLPASIELGLISLIIAVLIGFLVGILGVIRGGGKTDVISRIYGISTYALPPFWAAMIIQLIFAVLLGWLPVGGRFPPSLIAPEGSGFLLIDSIKDGNWIALKGSIRHLILPASTLGILLSGVFSRALKINLEMILNSEYIEAARSRGIKESQVILNHASRNTLLPILTIAGITIASLIGGALLIEVTFSWPGIALRLQEAINQRDYNVVQGIIVVISSLVVLISILVDLIIAIVDPRVQY